MCIGPEPKPSLASGASPVVVLTSTDTRTPLQAIVACSTQRRGTTPPPSSTDDGDLALVGDHGGHGSHDQRAAPGMRGCKSAAGLGYGRLRLGAPSTRGRRGQGATPVEGFDVVAIGDFARQALWEVVPALTASVAGERVDTPAMAARAKLIAARWVAEGSAGTVPVVTDCDYFCAGVEALARPHSRLVEQYPKGGDADLWVRLWAAWPHVRWLPAHCSAPGDGFAEVDWRGCVGMGQDVCPPVWEDTQACRPAALSALRIVHEALRR